MWGLRFTVEGLYFTTFRKPVTTALIVSYSIPPFTTIRGLLSNALGLRRDDLRLQEWIRIGMRVVGNAEKSSEMAKILKLNKQVNVFTRHFSSSPMFREFLVQPVYEIFLGGEEEKIREICSALKNPARPLYIGTSDDLVDIGENLTPMDIEPIFSREITGILEGIHENAFVEKIPYKFHMEKKRVSIEYKVVSIPENGVVRPREPVKAYRFGDEVVWLG